jgi:hypothetical protein
VHLEHATFEGGVDLRGVDLLRQRYAAGEGPEAALEAVEAIGLLLSSALALARDRQDSVVDLDRDLV